MEIYNLHLQFVFYIHIFQHCTNLNIPTVPINTEENVTIVFPFLNNISKYHTDHFLCPQHYNHITKNVS